MGMDTFEELLEAIEAYSDAKAAYNKAKEGARSAYFYGREENDRDRTKKRLERALEAHIKYVTALREIS